MLAALCRPVCLQRQPPRHYLYPTVLSKRTLAQLLHYERLFDDNKNNNKIPIVFLHGLLGNGRNVRTMARKLCVQQNQRPGLLVDLPGHGKSRGTKIATLQQAAELIRDTLLQSQQQQSSSSSSTSSLEPIEMDIVGHSLGGRLALTLAASTRNNDHDDWLNIRNLWLLDTVPGRPDPSVVHVVNVARRVVCCQQSIPKEQLIDVLRQENLSPPVAAWLHAQYHKNTDGRYVFDFDLDTAVAYVNDFDTVDFWKQLQQVVGNHTMQGNCPRVHLVQASRNPSWNSSDDNSLRQTMDQYQREWGPFFLHHTVDAGHWVHVDNLPGLLRVFASVEW